MPVATVAGEPGGVEAQHGTNLTPVSGFQSFHMARRTIRGFEAILWLRKSFGFAGAWTVWKQDRLLSICFGLLQVHKV
jgi:transposase, IS6 family